MPPPTTRRRGAVVCLDVAGASPPRSFRLFKFGKNRTSNGTFTLTKKNALAAVAAAEAHGADLPVDFCHAMVPDAPPADPALAGRAAGWFRLSVGPDGLYAVGVTWTAEAAAMIRGRQYRYISPAFYTNKDDEITDIINVAITNLPASFGLTPLVAHRAQRETPMPKYVPSEDVHAHATKVGELAEAMDSAKLKTLSQDLHNLADNGKDLPEDAADGGADDADENPDGSPKKPAVAESLSESDAEAAETLAETISLAKLARDVSGKTRPSEVRGSLLALQESRGEAKKLHARVTELEAKVRSSEVSEMVRLACKAGKISHDARKRYIDMGMRDPHMLSTLIEELPVKVTTPGNETATRSRESDLSLVTLSADEENMIRIAGIHRDAFIAARKAQG